MQHQKTVYFWWTTMGITNQVDLSRRLVYSKVLLFYL